MDQHDDARGGSTNRLNYVRLRAPRYDGQTLNLPGRSDTQSLLQDNLQLRKKELHAATAIGSELCLRDLQSLARREAVELAVNYTRRYLSNPAVTEYDSAAAIVFSGHQPTLFHPGVWYKNFRLSNIARSANAIAINLVVDNDLAGAAALQLPQFGQSKTGQRKPTAAARWSVIALDSPSQAIPFEMRTVRDDKLFASFARRASQSIAALWHGLALPSPTDPIVTQLWPEVIQASKALAGFTAIRALGHGLAAGRHRLESQNGLSTLEIPVSHIAGSESFARFAGFIIERIAEFQKIYNDVLHRYRALNRIRSSAHPVPELGRVGKWFEAPFWIWTHQSPNRTPMMVRLSGQEIEISTLEKTATNSVVATVGVSEWSQWLVEQNQVIQATGQGIFIRPRALITTMFVRLLASDLFIHGIGGAKYDQLTDQIVSEFFGLPIPGYQIDTGTWHLPADEVPATFPTDVTARTQTLRQMHFHPETFIDVPDSATAAVIQSKREAIKMDSGKDAMRRHQAIESANGQLRDVIDDQRVTLEAEIKGLSGQLRNSQIINSREISFCLHPADLIARLQSASV